MDKLISIQDLLAEHESNLSSYYQSGLLDTSLLYPLTNRLLGLIGVKILPIKEETLVVENYGVNLPSDYNSLILLLSTNTTQTQTTSVNGQFTFEQSYCDQEIACKDDSFRPQNEFGRYSIIQRIPIETVTGIHSTVVTVGTKIDSCVNPFNDKKYDAEIKNGRIITQFESGILYIQYRAVIANDNDILVPNYSEITSWLLAEYDKAAFKHLYYNTTSDVVQRLQYSDRELHIFRENARTFWKRHEVQEYQDLKKYLQTNFEKTSRMYNDRTKDRRINNYQNNWVK